MTQPTINDQYNLFRIGRIALDDRLHICVHEESYRYSIAYFDKQSEGYDLKFVGSRPFDYESDMEWGEISFMEFAKLAQQIVDFKYDAECHVSSSPTEVDVGGALLKEPAPVTVTSVGPKRVLTPGGWTDTGI